jgi:DNA-binding response OmpR family regulator
MANAPHILIVDNDRQIRASLARFLTASGFRVLASDITKMGIGELTIAVPPWLLTARGFQLAVTFVSEISLWLPRQPGLL